jgi:glucokinase
MSNELIVADIGGTNARFALAVGDALQQVRVYRCADYATPEDAIRAYLKQSGVAQVAAMCLAIAGPVSEDLIKLTNSHWRFRRAALEEALGFPVKVINDFTAQALCLDHLAADELRWLGVPRPAGGQTRAVLGPGTGLGVAALLPDGAVLASEGGHIAFAPTDPHQLQLLQTLWQRHPRISVERLLSGPGLENLYWANARLQGEEKNLTAEEISAAETDPLCRRAVGDFLDMLAAVAGDLALLFWSADGVYLSGGVLPRLRKFLDPQRFRQRFEDKGRFRDFCATVPIALVEAEHPGLLGCLAAMKKEEQQ